MNAIEQALKDAWTAGFLQGANGDDTRDIPPEWYFEQYMEKVVAELVEEKTIRAKPVAWMHKQGDFEEPSSRELDSDEISRGWEQYPLYSASPQREWVKLTYDEILHQADLFCMKDVVGMRRFVKTIEAMLKEKNQ